MTDKVQKIREEVERLYKEEYGSASTALHKVLDYIDSMQEEPASEDLEEVAIQFATDTETGKVDVVKQSSFFWGAIYHKQQMMKDSVLCGVDGWFINNKRNCRKNGRFYKYYESTITHDKPLPMENSKDYRLIIIKED